jgi:hypothetical protein
LLYSIYEPGVNLAPSTEPLHDHAM